ncbi:MAG: 2'-5' RNA ligase family protein [Nanoarchaeota archaeon]|nr:2'-5' RNA ligase family protein [Nanoarchaeota archaeon]MBU1622436.1 2'-5' RNA ligase family protein [Nanoarchaeota archaeon]
MSHYLIEFRFFGKAKWEMKELIKEVNRKFNLFQKYRPVPHISLVGPFTTNNPRKLVSDFKAICEKQELMRFTVEGFGAFENNGVLFININPDNKLDKFRWELSKTLQSYCNLRQYDYERKFEYHSTVAMKLSPHKFKSVKKYIDRKEKPNFKHYLMRVTLIRNQKIMYEYDFFLRKFLNRNAAKDRYILSRTFDELKKKLSKPKESEYFEVKQKIPEIDLEKWAESSQGFFSKIFSKPKVYCIGDLHLDHTNIIKYCKRPFNSTKEMNDTLVKNWNRTVKKNDVVLFLGDLAFGKGSRKTDYWLKKLNGNIIFVRGNHDKSNEIDFYESVMVRYGGHRLFVTHDPRDIPAKWDGWSICGHHHNNKPDEFPLINKKTKRINVGVELIDYKPILIDDLIKEI